MPAHTQSPLPDARSHLEHINLGQEKLQKAMDTALTHESAQPLFDKVRSTRGGAALITHACL